VAAPIDAIKSDKTSVTMIELQAKGYPIVSAPRSRVLTETTAQTTAETIKDLGNAVSLHLSSINFSNGVFSMSDIRRWHPMTRHLKVLRVIEEGMLNSDVIYPLLVQEIERSLESFGECENNALFELANVSARVTPLSEADEYYRIHRSYKNPIYEFERKNESAYASFYILANIGQPPPSGLLAKWIETPRMPLNTPTDMNVWLIDKYFYNESWAATEQGKLHGKLRAEMKLTLQRTVRSRWNAPWETSDPMLKMKDVDIRGLPTIEVLDIPKSIPADTDLKKKVIENFLSFARAQK
jgi:hypothetical protein